MNLKKYIFTLGEIGFNFKLREKLKGLFYRTDQVDWYRTRETLGYLKELTTVINFIQYSRIESK